MNDLERRDETLDRLNRLLRGELAAVETYEQALQKVSEDPVASELRRILADHETAVEKLKSEVVELGGEPSASSGIWGSWASLFEGTAKLFGPETAMRALREGEKHGIGEYEAGLEDDYVGPHQKVLIRTELLPQTHTHVQMLEQFIKA